jgi:hypothetical protein
MFRRVIVLIGASGANVPTKIEANLLLESAPLVIGRWTTAEVVNAFTLAMRGEIEAELKLYDKPFSLLYVSNVMKVYEAYRNEALHKHGKEVGQLPERTAPTIEEQRAMMRQEALTCYDRHCRGEANAFNYHPPLFDYLKEMGVICFSPQRIARAEVEAIGKVKAELMLGTFGGRLKELLDKCDKNNTQVQRKAKEMLLREFMTELQQGGNELSNLI